jgi:hypothetical protein
LTRRRLLQGAGIIFGTAALLFLIYVGYYFPRTGFGQANVPEGVRPAKTLWHWLKLLGVPVVLAVAGYLFTRSERQSTQDAAEQRTRDEALQTYLDQIGLMLLDEDRPLRRSVEGDELRNLARSRTLTVLSRMDSDRKVTVLRFLYESELIGMQKNMKPPIEKVDRNIENADFRNANLKGAWVIHMRADPPPGILAEFKGWRGIEEGTNLWFEHHAGNLRGAKMPNGKRYARWRKARRTRELLKELDEFLYGEE